GRGPHAAKVACVLPPDHGDAARPPRRARDLRRGVQRLHPRPRLLRHPVPPRRALSVKCIPLGTLTSTWTIERLPPFGLLAVTNPGADIYAVPTAVLETWIIEERVVVLRGFEPLLGGALPEFCETLGMVLDREIREDSHHLSLQWAGAFADPSPRY